MIIKDKTVGETDLLIDRNLAALEKDLDKWYKKDTTDTKDTKIENDTVEHEPTSPPPRKEAEC